MVGTHKAALGGDFAKALNWLAFALLCLSLFLIASVSSFSGESVVFSGIRLAIYYAILISSFMCYRHRRRYKSRAANTLSFLGKDIVPFYQQLFAAGVSFTVAGLVIYGILGSRGLRESVWAMTMIALPIFLIILSAGYFSAARRYQDT